MRSRPNPIQSLKQSFQTLLNNKQQLRTKLLNLALLSNPFLKQQQHYRSLNNELSQYNKRILDKFITDQYQVNSHQKLFSIICDLANLDTKQLMICRLEQTWQWWLQQKRRIKQRKDQGVVKYKTDREVQKLRQYRNNMNKSEVMNHRPKLPNQIRYAEVQPFQNNNRTVHEEMDIAIKRLKQYKHKRIDIIDTRPTKVEQIRYVDKVTYPMPPKYVPPEQIPPEMPENAQNGDNPPPNPENAEAQNNQTNPEGQPPAETDPNKPPEGQDPNQQDLGIGQEPGQPEEEPEEQVPAEDRLAPKNKIYTWSNKQREEYNSQKTYDRPYMVYLGTESIHERRMEDRTIRKLNRSLQIKREEEQLVHKAHEWASLKQKIDKQRQSLLESKLNRASFSYSVEEPVQDEKMGVADEKKYGFYVAPKMSVKEAIHLDDKLPQIAEFKPYERSIRTDRLKSLKHKFANILQLQENPERQQTQPSLCQVSTRKRDFSAILNEHSPERQRQRQLQEIQKIKASLGKQRINVNLRNLSLALVPDAQDYKLEKFQSPEKSLMNNPFWVEPAKKKKKKK